MKKDAVINIKGIYNMEGEKEVIELMTTGRFYKRGGHYYISYDESEATGFEGSKTTLKIENEDRITLLRSGASRSQLIIEQGIRHQCYYNVGHSSMMIGVLGDKIKSCLNDSGGKLEFKYSLDINTSLASENEVYIDIKCNS